MEMKVLKVILLSFVYIFVLLLYLNNDANRHLAGIVFDSFALNGITVFFFIALHFACKIMPPNRYYRLRAFETSGKLYSLLGVPFFKMILSKNPLPTLTAKLSIENYSRDGLKELERKMRYAEAVHIQSFLLVFMVMILFSILRDSRFVLYLSVFNVITNLYPALVQRYNRNRIQKIIKQ